MPSNTTGGWPYPLPTEPVRDGAVAIQNLAAQADKRLGAQSVVALATVGTFDSNGQWWVTWASLGVTWATMPVTIATVSQTVVSQDQGINVQIYKTGNSAANLVLEANYVKDGRNFTGNIDLFIIAIGGKP